MNGRGVVSALALALALGPGCARLAQGGDVVEHPTGPAELVLRVELVGGLLPPSESFRAIPEFSLYGDGTLITPGPQVELYPPPALPSVNVRSLTEEGVQVVLRAARQAGLLGPDRTYDYPFIADAPFTRFTVVAEGRRHVTSAYALGLEEGGDGFLSEEDRRARARLAEFRSRLAALESWLPAGSVGPDRPYRFDRLAVLVLPAPSPAEPGLEQPVAPWPLDSDLASFGQPLPEGSPAPGLRCGVVEGAELERLLAVARRTSVLTPWESGGSVYGLAFRPLLPDETGCPA